jgi:NTP pyrophosphatase (non-canonical NTP hydrolase)
MSPSNNGNGELIKYDNNNLSPKAVDKVMAKEKDWTGEYTFKEYSKDAFSTVMYPEAGTGSLVALNYTILAAVGEAGETANKLKKVWRGDKPLDAELKAALADEVGDVLWYLDRVMIELGYPEGLDAAAKMNIAKLRDRRSRNMTKGDGDKR